MFGCTHFNFVFFVFLDKDDDDDRDRRDRKDDRKSPKDKNLKDKVGCFILHCFKILMGMDAKCSLQ